MNGVLVQGSHVALPLVFYFSYLLVLVRRYHEETDGKYFWEEKVEIVLSLRGQCHRIEGTNQSHGGAANQSSSFSESTTL